MSAEAERLLSLMTGAWMSQSVYAAVRSGVLDALTSTPQSPKEVAAAAGCDEEAVARLLLFLSGLGVVNREETSGYTATDLARLLQKGGDFRELALFYGEDCYQAWGHVAKSIRTGETGWRHAFGLEQFDHLATDPVRARRFDRAMAACADVVGEELRRTYDFAKAAHIVDIGGGDGSLLKSVLATVSTARGTVVDRDHVVEACLRGLAGHELAGRLTAVPGDFFEALPAGADTYLLSRILHDWDDADCTRLLSVCHDAMQPGAELLIVERLLPEDGTTSLASRWDMQMLVATGGRERTCPEYEKLLANAGLRCDAVHPLALGTFLLVAVR
ncbi:acetylserotonin O-methyltransferase [Kitasatospora sp. RB6PN24]|uniref:acetylserotonin O-methyltransferase n=1 Tax=Kitasatospora humi TaxID=2893891 RepID=UPI001E5251B5|nr:acetylserotonin O-methyltransferase [Kitasatospora humi]MCC9312341.1 acetylserotonin O-methyltransferase [Kitasatospora humi]